VFHFQRRQVAILAQLRTGMSRLNGYLHQINAADTDQCTCGQAAETVEHFLFRCRTWDNQRLQLLHLTETRRGNLSFFLGGKTRLDGDKWTPDMNAFKATIGFALATGRLDLQATVEGTQATNQGRPSSNRQATQRNGQGTQMTVDRGTQMTPG
jgi:hypothetical protein